MPYIYKTGRIELYEQIKSYAGFIRGRVLDVGAGNFSRYQELFTFNEYVKMDIEPGPNTDVVGRAEEIPFPDDSFDSIVCTQVLGDIYELSRAFSEFYRVLKPEGTILLTESLFDPLHDEPYDFWRLTQHSLRRLALDAGFEIKVLENRGGYRSVMAQLKARYWIERLEANKKWFARLLSFTLKIHGTWARFLDRHDKSRANKLFAQGYILIIQKHA
ncbi:MAG TPA: methyltransferase domain-containing protein [Candidatus Paceibacterota bacterium]|nr:methyltransferase domain-containing protein [Candidatus Paceibacterota bacterium]